MTNTNYIAFGFVFGCLFTGAVFAVANYNKTYEIVITEPLTAAIDMRDWRMEELKDDLERKRK